MELDKVNLVVKAHLARLLRKKGKLTEAKAVLEAGLTMNPDWADGYRHLSLIHEAGGKLDTALSLARKAMELDKTNLAVKAHLSGLLRKKGKLAEAKAELEAGLASNPGWADGYHHLSVTLDADGEAEEALALAQKAVVLDNSNLVFKAHLVGLLRKRGEMAAVKDVLQSGLAINPNWADGYRQLSLALEVCGKPDTALVAARKAVELDKSNLDFKAHLVGLLRKRGEMAEAKAVLQSGLAVNPNWAEGYRHLSLTHDACGEVVEALALAQKAVELAPDNAGLKQHLAKMQRKHESARVAKPGRAARPA